MIMGALQKQAYDPHLLYHAINLTVELQYKVPMQKIYDFLAKLEEISPGSVGKMKVEDLANLFNILSKRLEELSETEEYYECKTLQEKIKMILRMMGYSLSDQELNQILRGELELDKVFTKEAKTVWLLMFSKNAKGLYVPDKEIVDHVLHMTQNIAIKTLDLQMQESLEHYKIKQHNRVILEAAQNSRTNPAIRNSLKIRKEYEDPLTLDKKMNKLRLYIAHMQGYDRDRDRDGGRGIDMTTGIVIDFSDIYIADKIHGAVIEDIEHNGLDVRDLH